MPSFSLFGREFSLKEAWRQIKSNVGDVEKGLSLEPTHNIEIERPMYPAYSVGGLPLVGEIGVFTIEHFTAYQMESADKKFFGNRTEGFKLI